MSLAGVPSSVATVRHARRDPRLAQAAVGIYARVDEVYRLADELARSSAGERVDAAAIDLAEGVPAALAILMDRAQLRVSEEPRFALDPCAVAAGAVAEPRVSAPCPRNPGQRSPRAPPGSPAATRPGGSVRKPAASLASVHPVPPREELEDRRRPRLQIEGLESEPVHRGGLAGKYPVGDRGEVLGRLAVALAYSHELAVERGARRDVGEGCEERSQTSGEISAVA